MAGDDVLCGGCMCGAVRYEAFGAPSRVLHCHCPSCRAHTGAAMATLAVFRADQVAFVGEERTIFRSSPGVGRAFCHRCGTPLTWETDFGDEGAICAVHISSFDDPEAFTPTGHAFYASRLSWFEVEDDLPRYEAFVAGGRLLHHGPAKR